MSTPVSQLYDALEVIGKGSFGTVRKVRQKSDGKILVRKEIEYNSMNGHERNQLISELRILKGLNHPNIVKYYMHDHIIEKKSIHIYMEYCTGGDLAQSISAFKKDKEPVPEELVWQVLLHMLFALHRCHYGIDVKNVDLTTAQVQEPPINPETVVIHRDIKPDNIFIITSGNQTIFKLGDFGLAKMLTSQSDFAKTYVGTPYYMSPEVLMDNPYSPVCDIWSLGCVLFELCTLQPPFQAKTHLQLQTKIKRGVIPEIPDSYSNQLRSIIRSCITVDPNARPSCFDLLENLSVRFLRKEMELNELTGDLNEFQKQLVTKNEELKKKESLLMALERKIISQKDELEIEFNNMQKKCNSQKKQLEEELLAEFEDRKKAMDLEAKEVRIGYQREFRLVVEQEVNQRVKEILSKQQQFQAIQSSDLLRKKSDPSSNSPTKISTPQARQFLHQNNYETSPSPNKPRGPKDLMDETHSPSQYQLQQQQQQMSPQIRRAPLKTRNSDLDYENGTMGYYGNAHKNQNNPIIATRVNNYNYKKRVTDELERLSLEKRHIPEFEELYVRKGRH